MKKQNSLLNISLLQASMLAFPLMASAQDAAPVKFNALLQSWMISDDSATAANPNFRIRRAELKASGTPLEGLNWFVMVDAAKSITGVAGNDNKILQDLGVSYTLCEGLDLTMGQFKLRTTAEGLASSGELPLPERSIVGRFFGDKREPGIMVAYKRNAFKTAWMISNGQKTNNDDIDGKKDLSARIEYTVLEGLNLGVFTLASNFSFNELARYGFNVNYADGALSTRAEAAYQKAGNAKGYGWMADVAYAMEKIEPVVRFEQLKPNDSIDITGIVMTAGVNYYLDGKKSKFQLAYSYLNNIDAPNGTADSSTVATDKTGNAFYVVFQAAL